MTTHREARAIATDLAQYASPVQLAKLADPTETLKACRDRLIADAQTVPAAVIDALSGDSLVRAVQALGVIGGGYCYCSQQRSPDKSTHEPECADVRDALGDD